MRTDCAADNVWSKNMFTVNLKFEKRKNADIQSKKWSNLIIVVIFFV